MRFYSYGRNKYNEFEFMEDNFLFEIKKYTPAIGIPFRHNDKIWTPRIISYNNQKAVVDEIQVDSNNKECNFEEHITCPICGYTEDDSFEYNDDEFICPRCGAVLDVEVEHTVTYSTMVKLTSRIEEI